jgi:hypothetical protein
MGSRNLVWLLLVVVILIAVLPRWPYAADWGYGPTGIVSVILIVLVIMLIMGLI